MEQIGRALPYVAFWFAVSVGIYKCSNEPAPVDVSAVKCPEGYSVYYSDTPSKTILKCEEITLEVNENGN